MWLQRPAQVWGRSRRSCTRGVVRVSTQPTQCCPGPGLSPFSVAAPKQKKAQRCPHAAHQLEATPRTPRPQPMEEDTEPHQPTPARGTLSSGRPRLPSAAWLAGASHSSSPRLSQTWAGALQGRGGTTWWRGQNPKMAPTLLCVPKKQCRQPLQVGHMGKLRHRVSDLARVKRSQAWDWDSDPGSPAPDPGPATSSCCLQSQDTSGWGPTRSDSTQQREAGQWGQGPGGRPGQEAAKLSWRDPEGRGQRPPTPGTSWDCFPVTQEPWREGPRGHHPLLQGDPQPAPT